MSSEKIAVIGQGAMARALQHALARGADPRPIGAALVRSAGPAQPGLATFTSADDLLAWEPALVVECAGHSAVAQHVPQLLEAGVPVILVSVGALAGAALRDRLRSVATKPGLLTLVPGAIGGLDALRAARLAGLDEVIYSGTKPPSAWAGSHAETLVDLRSIRSPTVIFSGSAQEAATLFPKNANVCAAVALNGLGFEETRVRLTADPDATGNMHRIAAVGAFGRFEIALENAALPGNPKTSWLAALSVEAAVREHFVAAPF